MIRSSAHRVKLFPMKEKVFLPLDYINTTGMIDMDYPVNIGGVEYIAIEVSITLTACTMKSVHACNIDILSYIDH